MVRFPTCIEKEEYEKSLSEKIPSQKECDETISSETCDITIALAGNANVGKSVIFNHITGSDQVIGNWPGKTVKRAEGNLYHHGQKIHVIDLPGIYSFSTFSMEEIVSREYIAHDQPDVVINVLDASVLERNLFFTLQLMEMDVPMVVCLNQMDIAQQKGFHIYANKLEKALGVPVVPTVAVTGKGLHKLVRKAIEVAKTQKKRDFYLEYGGEVEKTIGNLSTFLESEKIDIGYSARWVAIKLLENDPEINSMVQSESVRAIQYANHLAHELEKIHDEPSFAIIASERYALASKIAAGAQKQKKFKMTPSERLDKILIHPIYGYFTSALVIVGLLVWTFVLGNFISDLITNAMNFFQPVDPVLSGPVTAVLWNGAFGGLVAGLTLIVPFVIPFYILLAYIQNSGLLTRVAFMMDSFMQKIGLHGKALIPLILGYGCSVPAIDSTRILETKRERLLAAFAITFAPCAARTIIILSLVAVFVSIWWALALYVLDLIIIFIMGKIALKTMPGEAPGLIMEMHSLRIPSSSVILKDTWNRTKSLAYMVFPVFIAGSALIQFFYVLGLLEPLSNFMAPLTVGWLKLPLFAGVLLIVGIVRKEFVLVTLVSFVGTDLSLALNSAQFIVLALVGMLYLPCLSTLSILIREFGLKAASVISIANLFTAFLVGGIVAQILWFFL
ncbi:MAG: ferrous iron transport protein B [Euryarchaeota archaeon]|jgi:ferrous iron transport protein B|uniref:ferrous iron transport protein B n=1 Tax=Methanobacterium sp. MZD130B TaxID=3394378 RepID=UPI001750D780|nr:ferrous iron transport protein B [Euryarchaeota archaeon]HHT18918.1 ferrous iron transport protein B [Methanobacterium sp.]